jgi:hypothetical protein
MLKPALILIVTAGLPILHFPAVRQDFMQRPANQDFYQSMDPTPRATIAGRIHLVRREGHDVSVDRFREAIRT